MNGLLHPAFSVFFCFIYTLFIWSWKRDAVTKTVHCIGWICWLYRVGGALVYQAGENTEKIQVLFWYFYELNAQRILKTTTTTKSGFSGIIQNQPQRCLKGNSGLSVSGWFPQFALVSRATEGRQKRHLCMLMQMGQSLQCFCKWHSIVWKVACR